MHLFFISTGDFTCVLFVIMRNIIVIVLCTVFVCVRSNCDDPDCVETVIRQILDNETATDKVVDLKLEVPEFKQLKNIEIKDVNSIILSLTKWFENKLNESNYVYTAVNNKTKIFVKSFDFNIDFEHGNARIDMGLAKEPDVTTKNNIESVSEESLTVNKTTSTTTVDPSIEIDSLSNKITEAIGYNIKAVIKSQKNLKENDIYNTMDFDTTYYDQNEDNNSTDYPMIDYIDIYKDTTNEEYLYTGTEFPTTLADLAQKPNEVEDISFESLLNDTTTFTNTVFPWVATIFIKNSTDNSQFHYYCDGALLSEKVILTGGRCVYHSSGLVAPENILVFLGKANLQSMGGNEKLHRVKNVVLHHNFTIDYMSWAVHDLALLILDVAAVFDDRVQSACLHNNMDEPTEVEEAATTSWGPSGQLLPIFFEKQRSDICLDKSEDIFCATYGANVPLCPNYGGIYVAKRMSRWCVQGLFYGDPSYRGLCFNKNVLFTSLRNYYDWIDDYIVINSNIL